jgi:hypothetical protein
MVLQVRRPSDLTTYPRLNTMKHLLTLTALLISSLAMGQMPYNPDSNGDYLIGASDLVSFLGLYNTILVDTTLTCSYEGTELESWVGGIFDGSLILDSVYVEYLITDSVPTYFPGCPEPVYIETVLERSYVLTPYFASAGTFEFWGGGISVLGYAREFQLRFYDFTGIYILEVNDDEVRELTGFNAESNWVVDWNTNVTLPFPENWTLNEDGIQVDWVSNDWVSYCENFRLIPFWHEAE